MTLSTTACEDIASGIVIGLVKRGASQADCERILRLALLTVESMTPPPRHRGAKGENGDD
jgi:hypothetical protein